MRTAQAARAASGPGERDGLSYGKRRGSGQFDHDDESVGAREVTDVPDPDAVVARYERAGDLRVFGVGLGLNRFEQRADTQRVVADANADDGLAVEVDAFGVAGIGAVAIIGGGVMYWWASRERRPALIVIAPGRDGAALTWSGSW